MEDFSKLTKKELIEKLKQQQQPQPSGEIVVNDSEREFARAQRMANVSNPHRIPFTEISDHKNVPLYTPINKRIGPLHPANVEPTMRQFKARGIQLYHEKRTPEQVEAFKQTDFYKREHAKHLAERKRRREMSSKGRADRMVQEVARETALAVAGLKKADNG